MTIAHVLGFPRIGARRELKFALEAHWRARLPAPQNPGLPARRPRKNRTTAGRARGFTRFDGNFDDFS